MCVVGRVVFSLTGWKIYFSFIDRLALSTRCIFKSYATKLMYQNNNDSVYKTKMDFSTGTL